MSKPTKARNRNQLTRAEIKAYEARRAAARQPEDSNVGVTKPVTASRAGATAARRPQAMSREDEYRTIKADMKRLVLILLVLVAVLIVAMLILG